MTVALILSSLFAAQAISVAVPGPNIRLDQQKDVAYEDMANGRTEQAIASLEAKLLAEPNDPAVLINLGTAYARMGRTARAEEAFQAALKSSTFYQLELADGSWSDSRQAARLALRALERNATLAAR
jgi:cytochrome c-type biogenesis protein CcmH/NrfG